MNDRTSTSIRWLLLAVLAFPLMWVAMPTQQPAAAQDGSAAFAGNNPVFGRNVAGTWFTDAGGFQLLQNIQADGTMLWSHNFEYGGGTGAFQDGAVYGTWQQSGHRQLRSVQLGFLYDGQGVHVETGRVSLIYTFDPDFETFTVTYWEDVFAPGQDPTDPDEEPLYGFGGTFTGKRLTMEAWSSPDALGATPNASDQITEELPRTSRPNPLSRTLNGVTPETDG